MPLKAGGGAKRNVNLEQGTQVSAATQRAATTTSHRHTEKLRGDTYQPVYLPRPAKREWQTAAQMHNSVELEIAQPRRGSTRHLKLSKDPYVELGRMIREHR